MAKGANRTKLGLKVAMKEKLALSLLGANRTKLGLKALRCCERSAGTTGGRQSNQAGIESWPKQPLLVGTLYAPIEPSWD